MQQKNPTNNSFMKPSRLACVLSALLFLIFLPVHAKQVSVKQAFDIARKYITPDRRKAVVPHTRGGNGAEASPFYVFNDVHGKGYVVVSGDDAMGELLAYSDGGTLDTLNANPGVKLLLQAYRERFTQLQQQPDAAQPAIRTRSAQQTVAPLLTTKWNQIYPYNKIVGYPYTGCVATAMAQIMFYHKWPVQGRGEVTYTVVSDDEEKHVDFTKSRYDWAHMKNVYDYHHPSTNVEKDAVALLMNDAGMATKTQYNPGSSGAYNEAAEHALQVNFDYTTAFVRRADEGTAGFTEVVRQELLKGYPVYLAGSYSVGSSGHAWVTDGVDERGLFHMNFGWGGQSDGYFSLTAADVSQSGSEFGGRPLTFKVGLIAILAHPNRSGEKPIDPSLLADSPKLKFTPEGALNLPTGHAKTFGVQNMPAVEMVYFINKGKGFKGDVGVGIYDMEGKLITPCPSDDHANGGFTQRVFGTYDNGVMQRDNVIVTPQQIKIDLTEAIKQGNGYYQLLPICVPKKEDGSWGEWTRMKLAPRMVIEINNGTVRVAEEDYIDAGFQLAEQPSVARIKPGTEEKVNFYVRNKGGLERTCYAKLQLLNADGTVAMEVRREQKTDFTGFDVTLLPFTVNIPATFTEGKYTVKLVLIEDNASGIDDPAANHYAVGKVYDKDDTFIDVSKLTTAIENAAVSGFKLTTDGNMVTLQGNRLQWAKLFDLNGRLMKHVDAAAPARLALPISDLAPGVYLIQVADNGRVLTRRFVKP